MIIDRPNILREVVSILFKQVFIAIRNQTENPEMMKYEVSILFKQVFIAIHHILQGFILLSKNGNTKIHNYKTRK